MTYHQLTREQRYQIASYLECGLNQREIAEKVGVHKSTISRELKRNGNRTRRGYLPRHAHLLTVGRRRAKVRYRLRRRHWAIVRRWLSRELSPQQIAERARLEGAFRVSHEWIYRYVVQDRREGGALYRFLRCQKRRRKRYGRPARQRGEIAGLRRIHERPAVVGERSRIGDFEGDTLAGCRWSTGVVTLTDRASRYVLLGKLEQKSASHTATIVNRRLKQWAHRVTRRGLKRSFHTLTVDRGQEFARHDRITKQLGLPVYFADPHSPWQRGTVENTNGLLRQYFAKTLDFRHLTERQLRHAEHRLNHRPRKCLGYRTPYEVIFNTTTRLFGAVTG